MTINFFKVDVNGSSEPFLLKEQLKHQTQSQQ